jgi:hypothetical protein
MGYVRLWLNPHWCGILQQDAGYFILGSCRESGEVSSVPQTIRFSLQNAPCQAFGPHYRLGLSIWTTHEQDLSGEFGLSV